MPSWFKKVFKSGAGAADLVVTPSGNGQTQPRASAPEPDFSESDEIHEQDPVSNAPKIRKVVNAPIQVPEEEKSGWSEEIKIKARVEEDQLTCTFLIDRPVLADLSVWFPSAEWSEEISPLAAQLFEIEGVGSLLLHDMTVSVGLADGNTRPWEDLAAEVGATLREYLKSGTSAVTDAFTEHLPSEEKVREGVQQCIDLEINPGIASHGGFVNLERVKGNTIFITMGGGCQGCAASAITLRQGIHTSFRKAVPQIGAIYDETDHAAGTNPYFNEIPAGMA